MVPKARAPGPTAEDVIAALDPEDSREDMYRLSYRDAALWLFAEMEKRYIAEGQWAARLRQSRFFALPMLFLHLHYLELELKHLIRKAAPLAGEKPPKLLDHGLHELWAKFRRLYLLVFQDDPNPRGFSKADDLFAELGRVDPRSQAMRYAKDVKGRVNIIGLKAINATRANRACRDVGDTLEENDGQLFMEKREREKKARRRT
jgi:hypothetical protein